MEAQIISRQLRDWSCKDARSEDMKNKNVLSLGEYVLPLTELGCFVRVVPERSRMTIQRCDMERDGSFSLDEDGWPDWVTVTAPEPQLLDTVNAVFGTSFKPPRQRSRR